MTVYTDKISRSEDSPPRGLGTRAAPPGLAGRPRPQRNTSALRRASSVLVTRMPEHGRCVLGSALPTPPGTPGGRGELPAAVPVLADIAAGVSVPGPRSGGPRPGRTAGTGLRRPAGWRPVVQPQDVARGPLPPDAAGNSPSCFSPPLVAPGIPGLVAALSNLCRRCHSSGSVSKLPLPPSYEDPCHSTEGAPA